MRHVILVAVLCAVAVGCGRRGGGQDGGSGGGAGGGAGGGTAGGQGGGSGGGSGGSGGDAGADQLDADEQDTSTGGGESSNAVLQLVVLADSLFDFDPTLDTTRTAAENAEAIERNIRGNLGSLDGGVPLDGGATGCGAVALAGSTLTVSFGAAPGCVLRNGARVSGSVSVTVTKALNTLTVALVLSQISVNGKTLDGSASWSTTSNTSFTVDADITSGTRRFQATGFSVSGGAGTATIGGTLQVTDGAKNYSMTFTNVTWAKGDCYPNGGTLRTVKGLVASTITFNAQTPTTGQVTVTTGRITVSWTLPAYGSCGVRDGG